MSNEIFKWQPHLEEFTFSIEYGVIKSEYDNGMTQRRLRFPREIGHWSFNYETSLYSHLEKRRIVDQIMTFFKARKGSYDNFYLPSWLLETNISVAYSGGTTLTLQHDPVIMGFTKVSGQQGNFIYICEGFQYAHSPDNSKHEVRQITNIVGNVVTINEAFTNTYKAGSKIQKAYKVHFANDTLEESFNSPYLWKNNIDFVEDIGGLF